MSKPAFRHIHPPVNQSLVCRYDTLDTATPWHYHPEIEILYVLSGTAAGYVGDRFLSIQTGQLLLLGSNLPHIISREKTKEADSSLHQALIVQFTRSFLGQDFFDRFELLPLSDLFQRAKRGLVVSVWENSTLHKLLHALHDSEGPDRIVLLLQVLVQLSRDPGLQYVTSQAYEIDSHTDEQRLTEILTFTHENFTNPITNANVAAVANLTETAFCRYFRSRTNKTYVTYLNEVRVAYACKLLGTLRYSVSEACFASGFNNLSYFIRQFGAVTGQTPSAYQKQWAKGEALRTEGFLV